MFGSKDRKLPGKKSSIEGGEGTVSARSSKVTSVDFFFWKNTQKPMLTNQ